MRARSSFQHMPKMLGIREDCVKEQMEKLKTKGKIRRVGTDKQRRALGVIEKD